MVKTHLEAKSNFQHIFFWGGNECVGTISATKQPKVDDHRALFFMMEKT